MLVCNYYTVQLLPYQSTALKGYIHDSSQTMYITFREKRTMTIVLKSLPCNLK
jgi:hypothetical protein